MWVNVDVPEALNRKLKFYKLENNLVSIKEAIIKIVEGKLGGSE